MSNDGHACRTYWGHCGCDRERGHSGPHVGLHFNEDDTELTAAHVIPQDYEYIFGEDSGR